MSRPTPPPLTSSTSDAVDPRAPRAGRSPWVVLGFATITAALTGPGQTIGVAVFIDHFVDDLGLSRSGVSAAYLVGTMIGAALLPWVGRQVDRFGVRLAQVVIGIAFGLALVNMSAVQSIVGLVVGFVGIRFLGQGSLMLVSTVTVSLRFSERRGTALGIFATVSSGLMALVPVALALSIARIGWRASWLVAAAVVVAVVVPIAWFGLRSLPLGTARGSDPDRAGSSSDGDYDRGEAMRTRSFWMLAAVSGAAGMLLTALNFHQIDLMGEAGLSAAAAAALFVPQVVGASVAGLLTGYLGDRFGTRYLPAAGMALLVLAHLLAAAIAPGATAVLYSVALGAAGGAVRTSTASLLPAWFGTRHLGSIQGALTFLTVSATAIGPVALAVSRDALGSYTPAVLLLIAIPAAALIFSLGRDARRRPL